MIRFDRRLELSRRDVGDAHRGDLLIFRETGLASYLALRRSGGTPTSSMLATSVELLQQLSAAACRQRPERCVRGGVRVRISFACHRRIASPQSGIRPCAKRVKLRNAVIEEARRRYRPSPIKVLFVGESPPAKGGFFYYGNNNLLRHMRRAVGGPKDDAAFLESFCDRGWYLDDLVLEPIDDLQPSKRKQRREEAREGLAARIAEYRPLRIVALLRAIEADVSAASATAGSQARRYTVPFPGRFGVAAFLREMERILPDLVDTR